MVSTKGLDSSGDGSESAIWDTSSFLVIADCFDRAVPVSEPAVGDAARGLVSTKGLSNAVLLSEPAVWDAPWIVVVADRLDRAGLASERADWGSTCGLVSAEQSFCSGTQPEQFDRLPSDLVVIAHGPDNAVLAAEPPVRDASWIVVVA